MAPVLAPPLQVGPGRCDVTPACAASRSASPACVLDLHDLSPGTTTSPASTPRCAMNQNNPDAAAEVALAAVPGAPQVVEQGTPCGSSLVPAAAMLTQAQVCAA